MRPALSRTLKWAGIAAATPLALIGGVLAALQIPAMQQRLADYVSETVSGPDFALKIDGLSGGLPFGPRIARLELGDGQGAWLTLEDAAVAVDPWALIRGRIHVERIEAKRLAVERLPAGSPAPEPAPAEPASFALPELPRGLALDRLSVQEIELGAAVAGRAAQFVLSGHLGVDAAGEASLVLSLDPLAGQASTRLVLDARHRPADDHLNLKLALDEPPGGPIAHLAGLAGGQPIHLSLAGEGPVSAFAADLDAAAAGAALNGRLTLGRGDGGVLTAALAAKADPGPFLPPDLAPLATDGIAFDLALSVAGETITVQKLDAGAKGLTLAAQGALVGGKDAALTARMTLDPALDLAPLGPVPPGFRPASVELAARADLAAGSVHVERIAVTAPAATVTGTAELADGFGRLDASLDATLPDLAALPGAGLQGAGNARVKVSGGLAPLDLVFDVALNGKDVAGDTALPRLLGPSPALTLAGRYGETGSLVLDRLTLATAAATAEASGRYGLADGTVEATLAAKAEDLGRLGVAGLAGSLAAQGKVSGTVAVPLLDLTLDGSGVSFGGQGFGDPHVALKAAPDAAGTSTGRLDLAVGGAYPATLGAYLAFDGARASASGLTGSVLGVKLAGDLAYGLEDGLATGKLHLDAESLAALSTLAGQKLAGRLTADLALLPRQGGQGADLSVSGRGIAAAGTSLARLDVKATLDDLLGAGRGKAEIGASGMVAGGATLDDVKATATLASFADVAFILQAQGKLPAAARIEAKGRYRGGAPSVVTLASLDGALGTTPLHLEKPLDVRLGPAVELKGLALGFGKARVAADLTLGQALAGKASVKGFDFADVAPLAPGVALPGGTVDLDLELRGGAGRLVLAGRDLVPPKGTIDVAAADIPHVGLDATLDWKGRSATLDLGLSGIRDATVTARGTLPVDLVSGLPVPASRGEMDIAVTVEADLRRLAPLLPLGQNRIAGNLDLEAQVRGPLSAPEPSGKLTLTKGLFVNGQSGFELRDLALAVAFAGRTATLESLSGTDGNGGRLSGTGRASQLADGDFAIDAAIKATGFRFTRLDLATTSGDLDLAVAGTATAPEVTGKLTIREGRVEISATVPPSVPVVEVRDPAKDQAPPVPASAGLPKVGHIDMVVEAPGQFFVRGRGLDSEWRGTLTLKGPINGPDIAGGFEVVRGTYTLAGRPFKISEGSLTFPSGLAAPPQLAVVASAPADDVEAKVSITGPATALKIALSSDPALPSDEVLSRVLFGRSVANLSATQAVKLGQTALELAGKGGGSVLGGVRNALGLDRLDFGSSDSTSENTGSTKGGAAGALAGSSLSAGRYIADGVYLGFEQGLTPDSSSVSIEVEIYPRVTVEGTVGQTNDSSVGLNYKFDY
ncbi:translocation/assembly module TamB domain-containing protein [Zavarzinia sp.]|uniref:translocation/assembly module TamB domain-containing protein n=1 Tax=Zavarzinia sp. TaxID=2027920 RepID=UPI003568AD47